MENKLGQKDLVIITHLRGNARENLTTMSRKTGIPVSTIFDRLKLYENGVIKKHTALVDFSMLGYSTRANIMLKTKKNDKDALKDYLMKQDNVNSIYKINNNFDFLVEGVFRHIKELEDFLERLEEKFEIGAREVYYIVDEIKKEEFFSNPECLNLFV